MKLSVNTILSVFRLLVGLLERTQRHHDKKSVIVGQQIDELYVKRAAHDNEATRARKAASKLREFFE